MPNKIKAVVFDYGDVIDVGDSKKSQLESLAEIVNVPIDDFRKEWFKHNHLVNIFNRPIPEVILKVVEPFNLSEETKHQLVFFARGYESGRRINTELVNWFAELKSKGYKVGIFSNYGTELRKKLEDNGLINLVDVAVISGEIGHQKPHKEAFEVLFEKLDVLPREVVFIDDSKRSHEKSEEIGYIPILYKNNEQLREELAQLGVQI